MWRSGVLPTGLRWRSAFAALVASAALMAMLASPRPAAAHDTCVGVYYGGIQRAVACVRDNHRWLDGCDRYSDGLRARAWFSYTYSGPGDWDPNGADSGCAHNYFPAGIIAFRICVEQPVGCSEWKGA